MKKTKIIFWITTGFIFLFEGVMPALTGNTEIAVEGVRHLGYPDYFRIALNTFKIIGVLLLIIPQIPSRVKEWAYAGFAFNFIFATISHVAVDEVTPLSFFPVIILAVLIVSYITYHKLKRAHE
jgi:hypothetical protein